jgi:SAM-dependent methyltransferase
MAYEATASVVQSGTKFDEEPNRYEIVICKRCRNSTWQVECLSILRCLSCQNGVPIQNGVLNCLGDGECLEPAGSVLKEWDAHYGQHSKPYSADEDWWTLSSWEKHLFRSAVQNLENKLIVDFGCGTGSRVATIAPIARHGYRYVGVDSSLGALNRARNLFPDSLFIRADVTSPCLRSSIADLVLCLGVLMYAQDYLRILDHFLSILKPGGLLLLHEQLNRLSWRSLASRSFCDARNKLPSANGVDRSDLSRTLMKHGRVLHVHLGGSPFRSPVRAFFRAVGLDSAKSAVAGFDSAWCSTIGRVLPSLGAGEVQVVFQKS